MKVTFFESVVLAGLLGCCSGSDAGNSVSAITRTHIVPVQRAVEVVTVRGTVEYAYDGTGWRELCEGKQLRAGATVRASSGSAAVLRVSEQSSLVKVSPLTALHLTQQTPREEMASVRWSAAEAP